MAIISISIPDHLKSDLDKFKKRMNVSHICQAAIMNRIQQLSAISKNKKEYQPMIERLSLRKKEYYDMSNTAGFKYAGKFINHMNYHELMFIVENECVSSDFRNQLYDEHSMLVKLGEKYDYESWVEGLTKGLIELYAEIEDDI